MGSTPSSGLDPKLGPGLEVDPESCPISVACPDLVEYPDSRPGSVAVPSPGPGLEVDPNPGLNPDQGVDPGPVLPSGSPRIRLKISSTSTGESYSSRCVV